MSIILQSTVGGFSAQFMRKLPLVEQAMREHGLDPAEFVISKDYASTATIPLMGPFFYNYSVFFGDEQFRHRAERHGVPGLLLQTRAGVGRPAGIATAAGIDAAAVRMDGAAGLARHSGARHGCFPLNRPCRSRLPQDAC
ncbi:hypothetical protein J4G43_010910 [Bradyrhizobium barranii subsp. barranii]|uniref:Uncharacterized protein n=2 Tax=Bradyrhizobium TaxID=374 RepID=A0A9X9Y460_9BRAD|nr:hypothetical protein [Bradyrhizobium barranii]UEM14704.1 hypothetical protein J4G43_010910 [Bradyrhizobium barranii subsp. barranii]